jgi:hypothetical protein
MAKGDRRSRGKGGRGPGRPRKDGPRDKNDRIIPEDKRIPPAEHILARRKLFSFVSPTEGPDGRSGEIDQDVCDGIGQFHALGLLDGYPVDGLELRNIGREWRDWFVTILRKQGFKAGGYERMDKATEKEPRHNERLDRMDGSLNGYERHALYSLLVDPIVGSWPCGEDNAPWVCSIIGEALIRRNRVVKMVRFPDGNDYALLSAAIRGLFALHDASLPGRYERRMVA